MSPEDLTAWLQLVSSGGFGALAWYLVVKAQPKMIADFRTDIHDQRSVFIEELKAQRREFCDVCNRQLDAFQATIEKIAMQFAASIERTRAQAG